MQETCRFEKVRKRHVGVMSSRRKFVLEETPDNLKDKLCPECGQATLGVVTISKGSTMEHTRVICECGYEHRESGVHVEQAVGLFLGDPKYADDDGLPY